MTFRFDLGLRYQFGFIFAQVGAELDSKRLHEVVDVLSAEPSSSPRPTAVSTAPIRFGRPDIAQHLVIEDGNPSPTTQITWETPGGLWRLTLTSRRMDVAFDALAYSEIAQQQISLSDVYERVADNLGNALSSIDFPCRRLAFFVHGEASQSENPNLSATELIASRFFNTNTQQLVSDGRVPDLSARLNVTEDWPVPTKLDGEESITVNRIETATAKWSYSEEKVSRRLDWQLDVNTSPELGNVDVFGADAPQIFFKKAVEWSGEMMHDLQQEATNG